MGENYIDEMNNDIGMDDLRYGDVFSSPVCPKCLNINKKCLKNRSGEFSSNLINGYIYCECLKCGHQFIITLQAIDIS